MANVQLENGYTRIADALLEALCRAPVPGRHHRVVIALIRLTYGYGKTVDRIATSQIADLARIDRRSVTRILSELEAAGMITRGPLEPGRARRMALVKDFDTWVLSRPSESTCATPGSAATPGAAARGGVAQPTPELGSPLPPSRERKRFPREKANRARSVGPRKVNPKTRRCPDRLTDAQRERVRTWCDREHPGRFSPQRLGAEWGRFRRWYRGKGIENADWSEVFCNWLTGPNSRPLTAAQAARPLSNGDWNRLADSLPEQLAAAAAIAT
jgi:phage replication O-like protein O